MRRIGLAVGGLGLFAAALAIGGAAWRSAPTPPAPSAPPAGDPAAFLASDLGRGAAYRDELAERAEAKYRPGMGLDDLYAGLPDDERLASLASYLLSVPGGLGLLVANGMTGQVPALVRDLDRVGTPAARRYADALGRLAPHVDGPGAQALADRLDLELAGDRRALDEELALHFARPIGAR